MSASALVRVRFPREVIERLDAMARDVGATLRRKVSRAALIRAIVHLQGERVIPANRPEIAMIFETDRVRRGKVARKGGAS